MMAGTLVIVIYNLLMVLLVSGALVLLSRPTSLHLVLLLPLLGILLAGLALVGAFYSPIDPFGKFQLLAWAVFLHCPLFLVGAACLLARQGRGLAYGCIVVAAGILLVGVDAFLIEPRWLEVNRATIPAEKLQVPVRVAIIADLQTDAPGDYEERVFRLATNENPDLILLAGDYLHLSEYDRYVGASETLNGLLRRADLDVPLGVYAVGGNTDWPGMWPEIFAGLPVTIFETSTTVDLGPLALTGLTVEDSSDPALSIETQEKFHIVLGHSPNFSLGRINADLLVAGHTHGGQVQMPFVGPILTLSQVPRRWASGVTTITPGKVLVVSRGVGMERGYAPRMRFLCRPELVILDLEPSR